MKKFLPALLLLFSSFAFGQITQEASFDFSGTYIKLANSGDKFYVMDVANSQCRIYNTDYTLWKTINLTVPANNYVYDIRLLSEGLFTNTNELCLAYVYYYYDDVNLYYTFNMKVIKENGTVLLSVPGCQYVNVYKTQSGAAKLVTYSYDYSIVLYTTTTKVFSLPGTITSAPEIDIPDKQPLPAFPNPASSLITIPYSLPLDAGNAVISLINLNGQVVAERNLLNQTGKVTFDVNGFPKGMYLYKISTANTSAGNSFTGKIAIQ